MPIVRSGEPEQRDDDPDEATPLVLEHRGVKKGANVTSSLSPQRQPSRGRPPVAETLTERIQGHAWDAKAHCGETRDDLSAALNIDKQCTKEGRHLHRLHHELVAAFREGNLSRAADIAFSLPLHSQRVLTLNAAGRLYWDQRANGAVDETEHDVVEIIGITSQPQLAAVAA